MFAQLGLKATTGGVRPEFRTGRGIYGDPGARWLCRKAEDFFYSHNPSVNVSQELIFVKFQAIEKAVLTESVFFHPDSNLAPNVRLWSLSQKQKCRGESVGSVIPQSL